MLLLHIKVRHHRLRGLKYKVPIPPDLPSVVCSVLTLPKYGNCRALCRLKTSANEVGQLGNSITSMVLRGMNVTDKHP